MPPAPLEGCSANAVDANGVDANARTSPATAGHRQQRELMCKPAPPKRLVARQRALAGAAATLTMIACAHDGRCAPGHARRCDGAGPSCLGAAACCGLFCLLARLRPCAGPNGTLSSAGDFPACHPSLPVLYAHPPSSDRRALGGLHGFSGRGPPFDSVSGRGPTPLAPCDPRHFSFSRR